MTVGIQTWEDEGGSISSPPIAAAPSLSGSESQVEWAERIRRQVGLEFDRVADSFRAVARQQSVEKRAETEAVIEILETKRIEVLARRQAGYFIHDWQEIGDQVRRMIFDDPRYQALKSKRLQHAPKPPEGNK